MNILNAGPCVESAKLFTDIIISSRQSPQMSATRQGVYFVELYPEEVCFYYWASYAFFDDPDGNPVVVYFDCGTQYSKATVGAIYAYDKNGINPTDEVFCSLEGGMLVQEIVSYVGNPDRLNTPIEEMVWRIDDKVKDNVEFVNENMGSFASLPVEGYTVQHGVRDHQQASGFR